MEKTNIRPFSDARKVGNTIYVSGQIPKDMETGKWGNDIEKQTRTCLLRIKRILEENGGKISDIVKTTVFLTNIQDYAAMNNAYLNFFKEYGIIEQLPARSVVQVGQLMYPEWFIELDCVAIIQ